MSSESILPYFHPTTVVVVDDNKLFLHTLDLRMPAEMAYELFDDPRAALSRVNRQLDLRPLPERCVQKDGARPSGVVEIDLSLIEEEIKHTDRFRRTSVVIVDYAMPQMNGLEFCASIDDPTVKKVMLTGVADEKAAVKAFNEGLIDRFISKNDSTTLDLVVAFALDLQRAYFVDQQRVLQTSLDLEPPSFLMDSAIHEYFEAMRRRLNCVEHYLVAEPPGFVMVAPDGNLTLLVILSNEDAADGVAFARQFGAPSDVIRELAERRKVGYFYEQPDFSGEEYRWSDYLHDAIHIHGSASWLVALVNGPPTDIDFDPAKACYRTYLQQIDHGV